MTGWKLERTIPAGDITAGMWITIGESIGPVDEPRKVKCAVPLNAIYTQVIWDEDPVTHRNIPDQRAVNVWIQESPYKTTNPDADPIGYQYVVALDVLDDNAAGFRIAPAAPGVHQPVAVPKFVVSRDQWESMGRPGFIELSVRGVEQ